MDLALNNLQRLICHKTQQTKPNKKSMRPDVANEDNRISETIQDMRVSRELDLECYEKTVDWN